MNLFFITAYCGAQKFDYINTKSSIKPSAASQTLNRYIVQGLLENDIKVESMVYLPCAPFPKCRVLSIKYEKNIISKNHTQIIVPFLNLQIIKQITLFFSMYRLLNKRLKDIKNKDDVVILVDYLYLPTCLSASYIAIKYNLKSVVLIPDIPSLMFKYMDRKDIIKQFLVKPYLKLLESVKKTFSGFILMTKETAVELLITNREYLVLEGIIEVDKKLLEISTNDVHNCIMYTGGLYEEYGIMALINSIKLLNDKKIELWIFGSGELDQVIRDISEKEPRIKYFGVITNAEMLKIQKTAKLLINPRPGHHSFTKYTFPSKILEYMTSGRPVAMTRLQGIPNEYYNYVYEIKDYSAEGIAKCINRIVDIKENELKQKAEDAYKFIVNNKNSKNQCLKIISLFHRIKSPLRKK